VEHSFNRWLLEAHKKVLLGNFNICSPDFHRIPSSFSPWKKFFHNMCFFQALNNETPHNEFQLIVCLGVVEHIPTLAIGFRKDCNSASDTKCTLNQLLRFCSCSWRPYQILIGCQRMLMPKMVLYVWHAKRVRMYICMYATRKSELAQNQSRVMN
jgi:hypothetical protein